MHERQGGEGGGWESGSGGKLLKEGGEMVVSQCMIQCKTSVCISEQSTGSKPGGEQLAMTGTGLKQGSNFAGLGRTTQQTPAAVQTHHADRQAVNTPAHSLQQCSWTSPTSDSVVMRFDGELLLAVRQRPQLDKATPGSSS